MLVALANARETVEVDMPRAIAMPCKDVGFLEVIIE
jgi:hypothetical protein